MRLYGLVRPLWGRCEFCSWAKGCTMLTSTAVAELVSRFSLPRIQAPSQYCPSRVLEFSITIDHYGFINVTVVQSDAKSSGSEKNWKPCTNDQACSWRPSSLSGHITSTPALPTGHQCVAGLCTAIREFQFSSRENEMACGCTTATLRESLRN
jgi:hypothetical protein